MDFDKLMAETPDPIIPFGKHKGNYASDINVEYLDWLIGQDWFVEKFTALEEELAKHLQTRPEWQNLGK